MQLVFHGGAHFTQEERLLQCLLRNKSKFREQGVSVPEPDAYRHLFRERFGNMNRVAPCEPGEENMIGPLLEDAPADRVLFSNAHFFGATRAALRQGVLYPNAPKRMGYLSRLFEHEQIELFMAIKNPATYLPECFKLSARTNVNEFLDDIDPRALRWSDTFSRIREAAPNLPITVWCNEDSPLIWPRIMREMAGVAQSVSIFGEYDLMSEIMSRDGMAQFQADIDTHLPLSVSEQARIMETYLEKFALKDAIEQVITFGDWTGEMVDELSALYDEDVARIADIDGVKVIFP